MRCAPSVGSSAGDGQEPYAASRGGERRVVGAVPQDQMLSGFAAIDEAQSSARSASSHEIARADVAVVDQDGPLLVAAGVLDREIRAVVVLGVRALVL